jgi:hypothetical protein
MAKASTKTAEVSPLEALAVRLEAMAKEAADLGEERVVKSIGNAAKSCRWFDKQRAVRLKRVGSIVARLKAKGLTAEEIVAKLTS